MLIQVNNLFHSFVIFQPKPKSKKQLQAEQRRRELEMATIAKELEEKKKKEEEKEQVTNLCYSCIYCLSVYHVYCGLLSRIFLNDSS